MEMLEHEFRGKFPSVAKPLRMQSKNFPCPSQRIHLHAQNSPLKILFLSIFCDLLSFSNMLCDLLTGLVIDLLRKIRNQ